jgi:hypothetical protein
VPVNGASAPETCGGQTEQIGLGRGVRWKLAGEAKRHEDLASDMPQRHITGRFSLETE